MSFRVLIWLTGAPIYSIYRSSDDQVPIQDEAFRARGAQLCTGPVDTDSLSPDHPSYHFMTNNLDYLHWVGFCTIRPAGLKADDDALSRVQYGLGIDKTSS